MVDFCLCRKKKLIANESKPQNEFLYSISLGIRRALIKIRYIYINPSVYVIFQIWLKFKNWITKTRDFDHNATRF